MMLYAVFFWNPFLFWNSIVMRDCEALKETMPSLEPPA